MQQGTSPKKLKRSTSGSGSVSGSIRSDRQLIRPSAPIPWSVDVVSAVPKDMLGKLGEAIAGASCHGWSCLGYRDGNFIVWQQRPKNLSETLEPPKGHLTIYIPDLDIRNDSSTASPLVGLAPTQDGESVHLYAANPTSGWLILRKISRMDLRSKLAVPQKYTAKIRIPLDRPHDSGAATSDTERLSSLTASADGYVVVGTSTGNLFWVTHTSVPPALHAQKVAVKKGLLDYIFSYSSSGSSSVIKCLLPMSPKEFVSISVEGAAVKWKVTTTVAAGHHVTFDHTWLGSISSGESSLDFDQAKVLYATLSADKQSIHWIVRGNNCERDESDESSRLYWIETKFSNGTLAVERSHWLSRFAVPDLVEIVGLAASSNGNTYGAFSHGGAVTVMILLKDCNIIQELDLPVSHIPSLLPNIFFNDVVTHGCSTIASSGIGIRVRYQPQLRDAVNSRMGTAGQSFSNISSPSEVQKLASHLRSAFWESYKDPDLMDSRMPPSLSQAEPADLEEAVVSICRELQYKGDASSSSQNPLEWHRALIKLLQEGGLYRSLSVAGRWKLVSIGQELAVFFSLLQNVSKKKGSWEQEQLSSLKSHEICDWLLQIQSDQVEGGWEFAGPWSKLLCLCLEAATSYREEWATTFYDVMSERPPRDEVCLWTSHRSLQAVLLQQIEYWKVNPSARADQNAIETVVKAALLSYSESFSRRGRDETTKEYCKIKSLAIPLLRSVNRGDDDLAFELSTEHCYFEGLCKIAVEHEKKWDSKSYSLDPLFATLEGTDPETGFTFAQFVLQWHTDAGLYGHAINYGRHSTADLNLLMKKDDRLRPFRWIHAIRQSDYSQATESCLANTTDLRDSTLGSNLWALCVAKLTTKMEATRSATVVERQKFIERKVRLFTACIDCARFLLSTYQRYVLHCIRSSSKSMPSKC